MNTYQALQATDINKLIEELNAQAKSGWQLVSWNHNVSSHAGIIYTAIMERS